ncbi:MAG TPA: OsmC family protein [Sphingomicrobium sp.]|jgi:organic hydroperoxide reductase OsmC/OhrA|nr:OsmC family protein [Sphingomicrobium sp.]
MAKHFATIRWFASPGEDFAKGQYSRAHSWNFDGLANVAASASPHIVPMPWANPNAVDPEEAFVASAASCHMLFFLDFARRAGVIVTSYDDEAEGEMEKGDDGKTRITRITLRPRIVYGDVAPTDEMLADLHHKAHEACFIANSITSEIVIEPR